MGRKSSMDTLPDSIKKRLDFLIGEGALTIDVLTAWLDEQGHPRSRSAVGRHKRKIDRVAARLRQSREIVEALTPEIGEAVSQAKHGRMLVEMLRGQIFDILMALQPDPDDPDTEPTIDTKTIANLSRSVAQLSRALRLDQDFENKIRERVTQEAREAAAAEGGRALAQKGLSAEEIRFWREDFLGVRKEDPDG